MAKRYKFRDRSRRGGTRPRTFEHGPERSRKIKKRYAEKGPGGGGDSQVYEDKALVERFDKAFLISLGLIALLSLLIFIPLIGPALALSLVPYLACNRGCRYVGKRNGLQVGFLVGFVWAIIELYILFQILGQFKMSVAGPGIQTNLDIVIIGVLFIANIIFCMIGGYTGGAKFGQDKIKKKDEHMEVQVI